MWFAKKVYRCWVSKPLWVLSLEASEQSISHDARLLARRLWRFAGTQSQHRLIQSNKMLLGGSIDLNTERFAMNAKRPCGLTIANTALRAMSICLTFFCASELTN